MSVLSHALDDLQVVLEDHHELLALLRGHVLGDEAGELAQVLLDQQLGARLAEARAVQLLQLVALLRVRVRV